MGTQRRKFLKSATTIAGGVLLGAKFSPANSAGTAGAFTIDGPFNGAVLNHRHGTKVDGGLKILVHGQAPLQSTVNINGIAAKREGTKFSSEVVLRDKETEITATAEGWFGQSRHNVKVLWDKNSFPRYGFEIDDNIFFLRDIARRKYASIFDSFYLKGLRKLHREYGTKFVLNTYFTDGSEYTKEKEFDLTQFPDRYKKEWQENSGWLRLTFHAYANKPDRPYQYARPEQLIGDLDRIAEQIRRFAGEETYTPPTIVHWGMLQPSAFKPMAERGVRVLRGYFRKSSGGGWDVNCNLDDVRSEYLSRHDALKDFDSGIVFSKVDMVCNSTPLEQIVPVLEPLAQDPNRAEIMDLMTHEQFFWPFYSSYLPDHFERLDKTFRWVTDHGYKPVFFHEGLLGA